MPWFNIINHYWELTKSAPWRPLPRRFETYSGSSTSRSQTSSRWKVQRARSSFADAFSWLLSSCRHTVSEERLKNSPPRPEEEEDWRPSWIGEGEELKGLGRDRVDFNEIPDSVITRAISPKSSISFPMAMKKAWHVSINSAHADLKEATQAITILQ